MTKTQFANSIIAEATKLNASPELLEALTTLTNEYKTSGKKDAEPTREKFITIDDIEYQWCTRHEVYEIKSNFKPNGHDCILATAEWTNYSKDIKKLNADLMNAALEGKGTKNIANDIKTATEARAARYDIDTSIEKFPNLENYNYDAKIYLESEV